MDATDGLELAHVGAPAPAGFIVRVNERVWPTGTVTDSGCNVT
jgi:hypothetical protein